MIPVLLTCGLLFAGGCAQDYFDGPESPPAGSVKFTVAVPGGVSAPGTRGLPLNDERTIDQDNFRILLFNENGTNQHLLEIDLSLIHHAY